MKLRREIETTTAHEHAHRFEQISSGILQVIKNFYSRRTKGGALESLRKLTGKKYKVNEMIKKRVLLIHTWETITKTVGMKPYQIGWKGSFSGNIILNRIKIIIHLLLVYY